MSPHIWAPHNYRDNRQERHLGEKKGNSVGYEKCWESGTPNSPWLASRRPVRFPPLSKSHAPWDIASSLAPPILAHIASTVLSDWGKGDSGEGTPEWGFVVQGHKKRMVGFFSRKISVVDTGRIELLTGLSRWASQRVIVVSLNQGWIWSKRGGWWWKFKVEGHCSSVHATRLLLITDHGRSLTRLNINVHWTWKFNTAKFHWRIYVVI